MSFVANILEIHDDGKELQGSRNVSEHVEGEEVDMSAMKTTSEVDRPKIRKNWEEREFGHRPDMTLLTYVLWSRYVPPDFNLSIGNSVPVIKSENSFAFSIETMEENRKILHGSRLECAELGLIRIFLV